MRRYCDASDWPSALRLLDSEIARAPQDLDLRAWRARVLTWSGRLVEARQQYLAILQLSPSDPDNWAGLATVYSREGNKLDALLALNHAVQLDPKRADLLAARARALRDVGSRKESRAEFEKVLGLDPASAEARDGLHSLREAPRHELRFGNETDVLSYTAPYDAFSTALASRWTPMFSTSFGTGVYERGGIWADKFIGSVTGHFSAIGAVSVGGAIAHDNTVIPRSEAFFDLDHGWRRPGATLFRGLEFDYGQHWYWYQAARVLALNGVVTIYFPRDWLLSFAATGARSAFSGTGAEWRPSGTVRLGFPLSGRSDQLSGNIFFAVGTENFASADQIGSFASQTYGGSLRWQFSSRQSIAVTSSYQRRTQNRTDTYSGLSYALRF